MFVHPSGTLFKQTPCYPPGLIPTCIHGHTFTDIDLVHYNIFLRDIQSKVHKHNCDKKIVHNKCWVRCELCKSLAVDISVGGGKCIYSMAQVCTHANSHITQGSVLGCEALLGFTSRGIVLV